MVNFKLYHWHFRSHPAHDESIYIFKIDNLDHKSESDLEEVYHIYICMVLNSMYRIIEKTIVSLEIKS